MFGIGIVVCLICYSAKQDEGRYLEVDEYGAQFPLIGGIATWHIS